MLKITSLSLSLLTVIAIVPASQAATNFNPLSIQTPARDLHSQVKIELGERSKSYPRDEVKRRRELEREREAARHRRHRERNGERQNR
jgi:Tfp pilus assembly PilM family ATPase